MNRSLAALDNGEDSPVFPMDRFKDEGVCSNEPNRDNVPLG